ncbi:MULTISPECIES: PolC-type DNA polymerase III [Pirellulaceae]|nr:MULTISPECIES: 3'-5' exonuclease [Pirellulaceae]
MSIGISSHRIADTPLAIIDFETTGLVPGFDRVVEMSVVRVDPGKDPVVVYDTLINPGRAMGATEIHGITDEDVENAPFFDDVAGELLAATKDCVIAAYNVYFDIKFLNFELTNAGVAHVPPHLCLMYLRTMLGLGARCKLDVACREHLIEYSATHKAADDALAAGQLFAVYRNEIEKRGINTFGDLARLKKYKFNDSFQYTPFPSPEKFGLRRFNGALSRAGYSIEVDPTRQALSAYWDTLKSILADLEVSEEEFVQAISVRKEAGLKKEQIRMLHAKAFSGVIAQFIDDQWLDDRETLKLRKLHQCLSKLGWAPGE